MGHHKNGEVRTGCIEPQICREILAFVQQLELRSLQTGVPLIQLLEQARACPGNGNASLVPVRNAMWMRKRRQLLEQARAVPRKAVIDDARAATKDLMQCVLQSTQQLTESGQLLDLLRANRDLQRPARQHPRAPQNDGDKRGLLGEIALLDLVSHAIGQHPKRPFMIAMEDRIKCGLHHLLEADGTNYHLFVDNRKYDVGEYDIVVRNRNSALDFNYVLCDGSFKRSKQTSGVNDHEYKILRRDVLAKGRNHRTFNKVHWKFTDQSFEMQESPQEPGIYAVRLGIRNELIQLNDEWH